MSAIARVLAEHGVAHRNAFLAAGLTSYQIGRARHSGEMFRVRRAWYAAPSANPEIVRAVRVGGSLTCCSALRDLGVWLPKDDAVHVAVPANAARLRSAASTRVAFCDNPQGVVLHWRRRPGVVEVPIDSPADSLAQLTECLGPEAALIALDSALNRRLVTSVDLERAFSDLPIRCRELLSRADAGSQSGLETIARYRLRRRGIRLRTQVSIPGVGRVDVLVGDRLVLELDGYGYHATGESFEIDRRRDLELHKRDYLSVRLSFRQVMEDWDPAERVIRSMIRRGDHLWPRRRAPNSG